MESHGLHLATKLTLNCVAHWLVTAREWGSSEYEHPATTPAAGHSPESILQSPSLRCRAGKGPRVSCPPLGDLSCPWPSLQ